MADKNLFAPPTKEERAEADSGMFAPPTEQELGSQGPSVLDSFSAGAQQGATLGHADEAGAAMGAGLEALAGNANVGEFPLIPGTKGGSNLSDLYNEYVQANRKRLGAAEAAHRTDIGVPFTDKKISVGPSDLGAVASGFLLPGVGQVAPEASMGAKMLHSAKTGAVMGTIAGEGSSEAPLLSTDTLKNAAMGTGLGFGLGAVVPPVFAGAATTAQKVGNGIRTMGNLASESVLGEMGPSFNRGLEGELLIGKEAAKNTGDEMLQFAKDVPNALKGELNQLGKIKQQIISDAADKGVKIDPNQIDDMIQTHLGSDPMTNLDEVRGEMEKFREVLRTAQEGPEVEKVTRQFFGEGNTEKGQFANLFKQKQAEQDLMQGEAVPQTQKDDFEKLFKQKQMEQEAIPGSQDAQPLELHYEPSDNPNETLGVIRQPQFDSTGNFAGYKKISSKMLNPNAPAEPQKMEMILQPSDVPGKSLGVIRQAIVDDNGQVTGYKKIASKLLNEDDAAKFRDMSETVREGGRDLSNPEQLYQLYKDLKQKSKFGDFSFKTDEVKKQTGQAINDVQGLLRSHIDQLEPTDEKIHALKQASEIIGMNDTTSNGDDPRDVMRKFGAMLSQSENPTMGGANARADLEDFVNKIKIANPELGHKLESQAQNLADKFRVTGALQKDIYIPRPLATSKAYAAKLGNIAGYTLNNITPDWMMKTASTLGQNASKATQSIGKVLSEAATKDDKTRNSIMFGLMQNPAYREVLKPYMPEQQPQPSDEAK